MLAVVPDGMEWPSAGLALKEEAVFQSSSVLSIGDCIRLDFDGAHVWQPPAAVAFSLDSLKTGLRLLAASVHRRSPGGLGAMLAAPDDPSWSGLHSDPLLSAAHGTIIAVRQWLERALAGNPDAPPPVKNLIGLGPGLTPSGDDFFCGVLTALNYLGHRDIAQRLAADVLPLATRETSLISSAYLRCAAQGEASAVLFDVLESLLSGGRDLEIRLDAVHAVGHTSGWDTLAGAVTVCAAIPQDSSCRTASANSVA